MSDSNQEPVCSSDELTEKDREVDNSGGNEAEAKPVSSPVSSSNDRGPEPDLVSSSNSGVEIRGGVRSPKPHLDDEEDDDSNDGGSNGGEFNPPPICSPFGSVSSNSKSNVFNVLKAPVLRPSSFKFSQSQAPSSSTPSSSGGGTSSSSGGGGGFILRPPKLIPNSGSVGTKSNEKEEAKELNNVFVPLEMTGSEGSSLPEPALVPAPVSSSDLPGSASAPSEDRSEAFVFGSNLEERAVADTTRKRKIDHEVESTTSPENKKINISDREVITGEEDEQNIMQLHVKLFIFDSVNSSWIERGRGTLRLNDSKPASEEEDEEVVNASRLIVRSKGSLRVMLNTKVWEGMRVEKVGDKGVRLMAVDIEAPPPPEGDDGKPVVKIFLIMTTSISDANSLVGALESRINKLA